MPNYCWNTTKVVGPAEDVEFFHQRVTADDGGITICDRLIPLPPSASYQVGGFTAFSDTGYHNAVQMWGTKWGDFDHEINDQPGLYIYQTAWGPMDAGWETISRMFPSLTFITHWYEEDFHYGAFACWQGRRSEKNVPRFDTSDADKLEDYDYDEWYEEAWEKLQEAAAQLGREAERVFA